VSRWSDGIFKQMHEPEEGFPRDAGCVLQRHRRAGGTIEHPFGHLTTRHALRLAGLAAVQHYTQGRIASPVDDEGLPAERMPGVLDGALLSTVRVMHRGSKSWLFSRPLREAILRGTTAFLLQVRNGAAPPFGTGLPQKTPPESNCRPPARPTAATPCRQPCRCWRSPQATLSPSAREGSLGRSC
jgi:hypothetical protein